MHYTQLCIYYALHAVRGLLLVVLLPFQIFPVLYALVSEWDIKRPAHDIVDDDPYEDYLRAEDPYYSKHYTVKRYTKKQHIKE